MAQIQKKPNLVVLQFTSFPEAIKPAMKAIQDSGMHASMQQESTFVYLHFPKYVMKYPDDRFAIMMPMYYSIFPFLFIFILFNRNYLFRVTRQQREDMAKSAKTLFQKCKDELAQVRMHRYALHMVACSEATLNCIIRHSDVTYIYM